MPPSRKQSQGSELQAVLSNIADEFLIGGQLINASTLAGGHIHDTYLAGYLECGQISTYVHQRLNRNVFRDPVRLMDNVSRVVAHAHAKLLNCADVKRRVLTLIPTRQGHAYYIDGDGEYWRTYNYIENTQTHDVANPALAYQAAAAFGHFVGLMQDLTGPRLHETIPNFHNTLKRYQDLCQAIDDDRCSRVDSARAEIDFAVAHQGLAPILTDAWTSGELPERVVHNDTKISNVLFDTNNGEALCVVDLDTVMPGLTAFDFGDLVRTVTSPGREDTRDLDQVYVDLATFGAVADGYLGSTQSFLNKQELAFLIPGAITITYETGIRFLTDYLDGDIYFKIDRPTHNLDRCRNQFKLVDSMEAQQSQMEAVIRSARGRWR